MSSRQMGRGANQKKSEEHLEDENMKSGDVNGWNNKNKDGNNANDGGKYERSQNIEESRSSGFQRNASKARFNQSLNNQENIGEERKTLLLKVFQGYTSFGERTNLKNLRSNKFHKMMQDTGIPLSKTSLDLLFVSENRHKYFALKTEAEYGI